MNARRSALLIIAATLAGLALRLVLLHAYPLREDEAIYSTWARAAWRDPLYLHTWPDKPPLFLWMQAGALRLFGASNAGARLLSIFAGTATIPLTAVAARRVWAGVGGGNGASAAVAAAWLLALNPFAISFAPTAYTDTLLVFWGMLALALGLGGRWLGAGAALATAIMTKQQGLLYLPLVAALQLVCVAQGMRPRAWLRLALGAALILLPVLAWDAARWATAPSPWDLAVRNYGALRLAMPAEWFARAAGWGNLLWYMGGNWAGWLVLAALVLGGAWAASRRTAPHPRPLSMRRGEQNDRAFLPSPPPRHAHWRGKEHGEGPGVRCSSAPSTLSGVQSTSHPVNQSRAVPWLLAAWALGFLLLHVVTTVQVWDRYLLPLAPVFAILTGGMATAWSGQWGVGSGEGAGMRTRVLAALMAFMLLGWPALTAARGGFPIGADHGDYAGLDEALAWVAAQGPQQRVLYHNALGWNAQFALYDAVEAGNVQLRWFASSTALADNAAKSAWLPRTIIVPDWASAPYLANALAQRGLRMVKQLRVEHMTVYSIVEGAHAQEQCAWCVSRIGAPAPWRHAYPLDPTTATPVK